MARALLSTVDEGEGLTESHRLTYSPEKAELSARGGRKATGQMGSGNLTPRLRLIAELPKAKRQ